MSNEELAVLAAQGDKQALNQLWGQVSRFVYSCTARMALSTTGQACMQKAGVTIEDLTQEGFLAVADAVKLYDPNRDAKFTTFLAYRLKAYFCKAIGMRTQRDRRDPLLHADRIERQLTYDDESYCLADTIPDPQDDMQLAEEKVFHEQLHNALESCMETLLEKNADVLRRKYYQSQTLAQIAEHYGVTIEMARQYTRQAIDQMRRKQRFLRSFYEEIMGRAYRYTGLTSWQHNGSSVERVVEQLEKSGLLATPLLALNKPKP